MKKTNKINIKMKIKTDQVYNRNTIQENKQFFKEISRLLQAKRLTCPAKYFVSN